MASLDEVKAAIEAEKAEVTEKLTELNETIQALKEQIEAGGQVTPEDLDGILESVQNIFVKES